MTILAKDTRVAKPPSPKAAACHGRELPILFSGDSVRAILCGQKWQTRRVVSFQNSTVLGYGSKVLWGKIDLNSSETYRDPGPDPFGTGGYEYLHARVRNPDEDGEFYRVRPRWEAGDRLWVRETWRPDNALKDGGIPRLGIKFKEGIQWRCGNPDQSGKWKSPIFMPRWASRITLEILGVRVERLQEISDEDAVADGVGAGFTMNGGWPDYGHISKTGVSELTQDTARMSYATLWDSLHGKGAWDRNYFIWVIDFKRIRP
jgi:hypothetical protein